MRELSKEERDFLMMMVQQKPRCWKGDYFYFYKMINGKIHKIKRSRAFIQLHLNKKLDQWEIVHHKDKNRQNDALENLEILNNFEHSSKHHNEFGKKPLGWKPANVTSEETIKRIKEIAKEMVLVNYSEISRKLATEGIKINSLTISRYLKEGV